MTSKARITAFILRCLVQNFGCTLLPHLSFEICVKSFFHFSCILKNLFLLFNIFSNNFSLNLLLLMICNDWLRRWSHDCVFLFSWKHTFGFHIVLKIGWCPLTALRPTPLTHVVFLCECRWPPEAASWCRCHICVRLGFGNILTSHFLLKRPLWGRVSSFVGRRLRCWSSWLLSLTELMYSRISTCSSLSRIISSGFRANKKGTFCRRLLALHRFLLILTTNTWSRCTQNFLWFLSHKNFLPIWSFIAGIWTVPCTRYYPPRRESALIHILLTPI